MRVLINGNIGKLKKMNYENTRIYFQSKEIENVKMYGFYLVKNHLICEFFTAKKEDFFRMRDFLIYKLIMITFHEDFEVKKMIGKGSFAKVYSILQFLKI